MHGPPAAADTREAETARAIRMASVIGSVMETEDVAALRMAVAMAEPLKGDFPAAMAEVLTAALGRLKLAEEGRSKGAAHGQAGREVRSDADGASDREEQQQRVRRFLRRVVISTCAESIFANNLDRQPGSPDSGREWYTPAPPRARPADKCAARGRRRQIDTK